MFSDEMYEYYMNQTFFLSMNESLKFETESKMTLHCKEENNV
jgi:hypothetical protein